MITSSWTFPAPPPPPVADVPVPAKLIEKISKLIGLVPPLSDIVPIGLACGPIEGELIVTPWEPATVTTPPPAIVNRLAPAIVADRPAAPRAPRAPGTPVCFHDSGASTVPLPAVRLHVWPALVSITRRDGEPLPESGTTGTVWPEASVVTG